MMKGERTAGILLIFGDIDFYYHFITITHEQTHCHFRNDSGDCCFA